MNKYIILVLSFTISLFCLANDSISLHSSVLLKNNNNLIPLQNLNHLKIASLNLAANSSNTLEKICDNYTSSQHFHFNTFSSQRIVKEMLKELKDYNLIIVNTDTVHEVIANMIENMSKQNKVILNLVGVANIPFEDLLDKSCESILYSPHFKNDALKYSAQIIFGGLSCNNVLKKSITSKYLKGSGLKSGKIRLSYVNPKDIGVKIDMLYKIDSIANEGINNKAMPGCQILAAKNGNVFYQKSFGKHTYDSLSKKVDNNDIYDLASITKIASSALILMKQESENNFSVDSTLGYYLPNFLDSTEYKDLVIQDVLTHQAGLASWIPFYIQTLIDGRPSYELYSKLPSSIHQNLVAEDLYMLSSYRDSIFNKILATNVEKNKKYRYSDIGYYFINEIIKRITGENQNLVAENIYKTMGLENIGYHPLEKWDLSRITPTENDTFFRHQLIHGYVHDQGAALLGGVGGHAGLFSNANDLATVMQMYLNKGTYGGDTLIDSDVIEKYTSSPYYESNNNRRGIAFDKPVRDGAGGPTCFECASVKSFGHSGFTGDLTWADPESGILYVFLSNRVYPNAENHKLINMNIRTEIMNVITNACDFSTSQAIVSP